MYTLSINRRIKIMMHWSMGRRNEILLSELLSFLFSKTFRKKAKAKIRNIEDSGSHLLVYFYDFDYPLYYPKEMAINHLFQVIAESFYGTDWHYYEIPETRVGIDDTVIDCGAAEGIFSFLVANRCKKIYAIEPLPAFL
jgi:hypothetical protein